MENFNILLNNDQINVVLRALDQQPHGQVRQTLDHIIVQVNNYAAAQKKPAQEAATSETPTAA